MWCEVEHDARAGSCTSTLAWHVDDRTGMKLDLPYINTIRTSQTNDTRTWARLHQMVDLTIWHQICVARVLWKVRKF